MESVLLLPFACACYESSFSLHAHAHGGAIRSILLASGVIEQASVFEEARQETARLLLLLLLLLGTPAAGRPGLPGRSPGGRG